MFPTKSGKNDTGEISWTLRTCMPSSLHVNVLAVWRLTAELRRKMTTASDVRSQQRVSSKGEAEEK